MIRRTPRSTRLATLFPYTTLFRPRLSRSFRARTHSGLARNGGLGRRLRYGAERLWLPLDGRPPLAGRGHDGPRAKRAARRLGHRRRRSCAASRRGARVVDAVPRGGDHVASAAPSDSLARRSAGGGSGIRPDDLARDVARGDPAGNGPPAELWRPLVDPDRR